MKMLKQITIASLLVGSQCAVAVHNEQIEVVREMTQMNHRLHKYKQELDRRTMNFTSAKDFYTNVNKELVNLWNFAISRGDAGKNEFIALKRQGKLAKYPLEVSEYYDKWQRKFPDAARSMSPQDIGRLQKDINTMKDSYKRKA